MDNKVIKNIRPLGFPWQTQDPFLFCVHHQDNYPQGNEVMGPAASLQGRTLGQDFALNSQGWRMYHGEKVPGFPAHPHCGFETVTVVAKGLIDHSDSLGAAGRFGNGDVQWMTAGGGVQHSEMFPLLNQDKGNPLELFQIWLNLPKNRKSANPHFAMLWNDTIPWYNHRAKNGKKVTIKVIAGQIDHVTAPSPAPDSWAADPVNEVAIWVVNMEPYATWTLPVASPQVNRSIYFYEGASIQLAEQEFTSHQVIELFPDQEAILQNGEEESHLLMLQGRPINEPVVQYGPFVGNTQADIQRAMAEFQRTQFGGWPWPSYEHVHSRSRGRFAKYPNGVEEIKE